jgi:hypothetical protein
MSRPAQPVVVFFAFANDRADRTRYLRNLPDEQRHVRDAMAAAVEAGLCEIVERANATVDGPVTAAMSVQTPELRSSSLEESRIIRRDGPC